jgi:hypothetical protein
MIMAVEKEKYEGIRSNGKKSVRCETAPVRGREGTWGCDASRLPLFLDNGLQMAVSLPPLSPTPLEDYWYLFLLEDE